MVIKRSASGRKGTWTLRTGNPTLPPLQEYRAEEEDYPAFESHGPIKQSFLAKIFLIKPLSQVIQTILPPNRLRRELMELLLRWESMGIGIVNVGQDPRNQIIRAQLRSHNSVGLKAMRLRIEVTAGKNGGANALFSQERGIVPLEDVAY
jgi:hypothetical protein